jgi:8-oxo-dGTP diphosphatase
VSDLQQLIDGAGHDGIDKLVVGAVVHHASRVLIVRRTSGDFMSGIEELPSGGVEPDEDLLAALARELAEEVGWSGTLITDPGFVSHFDYVSASGRAARQFTFAVAAPDRKVTLSGEHTEYRWIDPAEAEHSDLTPESIRTIHRWAEHAARLARETRLTG